MPGAAALLALFACTSLAAMPCAAQVPAPASDCHTQHGGGGREPDRQPDQPAPCHAGTACAAHRRMKQPGR
jgi:hypothetical protein